MPSRSSLPGTIAAALPAKPMRRALDPVIGATIVDFGNKQLGDLGLGAAFDVSDPKVVDYLSKFAAKNVTQINETTRKHLRETLTAGVAAGESTDKLRKRIQSTMVASRRRAITIARTEVVPASNYGATIAMDRAGIELREWLATFDNVVRQTHALLDGTIKARGEKFISASGAVTLYPGGFGVAAEDINCRCGVLPVIGKPGEPPKPLGHPPAEMLDVTPEPEVDYNALFDPTPIADRPHPTQEQRAAELARSQAWAGVDGDKLSVKDKQALWDYMGSQYSLFNKKLRENHDDFSVLDERQRDMFDAMKRAYIAAGKHEKRTLYRGMRLPGASADERTISAEYMKTWQPGKKIEMWGWQSFSLDRRTAANFTSGDEKVVFELVTQSGAGLSALGEGEAETIMPHGTRYRIIDVKQNARVAEGRTVNWLVRLVVDWEKW